jgi:putative NADH-flavin reductase
MKIAVFGATGFVGREVVNKTLLQMSHQVNVLVRKPMEFTFSGPQINIFQGDALDRVAVRKVLEGCDTVIQCLGIGGKGNGQPTTFISDATKIIVEEMERLKINRLIALSNIGAGNSIAFQPWIFTKVILPYFMRWLNVIVDDKNRMEPIIMGSSLNWTIIRCPNITDKPAKGNVNVTLDGHGLTLSIRNEDLANFLVSQFTDTTYFHQAPSISN